MIAKSWLLISLELNFTFFASSAAVEFQTKLGPAAFPDVSHFVLLMSGRQEVNKSAHF